MKLRDILYPTLGANEAADLAVELLGTLDRRSQLVKDVLMLGAAGDNTACQRMLRVLNDPTVDDPRDAIDPPDPEAPRPAARVLVKLSQPVIMWIIGQGDEACRDIANLLLQGTTVQQNLYEARNAFGYLANKGHAYAQDQCGQMHEHGIGMSGNLSVATMYYERAAKQGHGSGYYHLGMLRLKRALVAGHELDDRSDAYRLLLAAGNTGVPEAAVTLLSMLNDPIGSMGMLDRPYDPAHRHLKVDDLRYRHRLSMTDVGSYPGFNFYEGRVAIGEPMAQYYHAMTLLKLAEPPYEQDNRSDAFRLLLEATNKGVSQASEALRGMLSDPRGIKGLLDRPFDPADRPLDISDLRAYQRSLGAVKPGHYVDKRPAPSRPK